MNRALPAPPRGAPPNSSRPVGTRRHTQWDCGRERGEDGDQRDRGERDRPNINRVMGSRGMIEFKSNEKHTFKREKLQV